MSKNIVIIGGGAAGFFTAITTKEKNPDLNVLLLEKSKEVLQKVKISGGGRCNVTHACFVPSDLVQSYPRGQKELLGPFHQFMTGDAMEWFEQRGVPLKIEKDNRVFPESNSSQSIVDCFQGLVDKLGIQVLTNHGVNSIEKTDEGWEVFTENRMFKASHLVIAGGSSKRLWDLVSSLGHSIVPPVPSLFTFKIKDPRLTDLLGTSVSNATITLKDSKFEARGPLLITHWGLSGPAVLKLSAFAARVLAEKKYVYQVQVNWLSKSLQSTIQVLQKLKKESPKKQVALRSPFPEITKRLWERFVHASLMDTHIRWADLTHKKIAVLAAQLTQCQFSANGKSTFKEEFVTAGGIDLREINFKRFESKVHDKLFFAGEILNIDAITGGFNFQNAWTGGFLIGSALAAD